ncbi:uncharacterized protein RAG0_12655 [Rhynchosporium agropyri]|uniref:Uncharacterized protein n=1 Tax=Rhynchosporium agropyri TaxID=914238 RepID=A0A1E1L931_9HELO|nr:uncharacterized protein RAG0_12655 [Rhynchosporium agropyri]
MNRISIHIANNKHASDKKVGAVINIPDPAPDDKGGFLAFSQPKEAEKFTGAEQKKRTSAELSKEGVEDSEEEDVVAEKMSKKKAAAADIPSIVTDFEKNDERMPGAKKFIIKERDEESDWVINRRRLKAKTLYRPLPAAESSHICKASTRNFDENDDEMTHGATSKWTRGCSNHESLKGNYHNVDNILFKTALMDVPTNIYTYNSSMCFPQVLDHDVDLSSVNSPFFCQNEHSRCCDIDGDIGMDENSSTGRYAEVGSSEEGRDDDVFSGEAQGVARRYQSFPGEASHFDK